MKIQHVIHIAALLPVFGNSRTKPHFCEESCESSLDDFESRVEKIKPGNRGDLFLKIGELKATLKDVVSNSRCRACENNKSKLVVVESIEEGVTLKKTKIKKVKNKKDNKRMVTAIVEFQFQPGLLNFMLNRSRFINRLPSSDASTKMITYTHLEFSYALSIDAYRVFGNQAEEQEVEVEFEMDVSNDTLRLDDNGQNGNKFTEDIAYLCCFLDPISKVISSEGCSTQYNRGMNVNCKCDHATIFVVLLSVTNVVIPEAVKVIIYITESVSIFFLLVTAIILFAVRKSVRGDRVMIQIYLVISLMFLHLMSIFSTPALGNNSACEMVAVLTHYFLLSSALWMLWEGITLTITTTDAILRYNENSRMISRIRHISSWGLPALIVILTASTGFANTTYIKLNPQYAEYANRYSYDDNLYRKYNICWLRSPSISLWCGVVVPMGVILLTNCVILVRLSFVIYRMSLEKKNFRTFTQREKRKKIPGFMSPHARSSLRVVFLLLPVLGVPWILGFLVGVEDTSDIFLYVTSVLNGLQGLFLFIIYCIIAKDVRSIMLRKWNRNIRPLKQSIGGNRIQNIDHRSSEQNTAGSPGSVPAQNTAETTFN